MIAGILDGLRVVEGSAFVAAPLGGMTLAQLGADVIRFDHPGGGIFLTNFPARGWLAYEQLAAARPDLIMVVITGNSSGSSEVDYTVNPATGFPAVTGPRGLAEPVNSVFPAWDTITGMLAAIAILAAERHRRLTGEGQLVELALSDVALAMTGHLGRIAQAQLEPGDPAKDGNHLYGAFGHDFATRDGRRVMVVALTGRQWRALVKATGTQEAMGLLEKATGEDLASESGRYRARDAIAAVLRPWFASRDLATVRQLLGDAGACWGPYQTFTQLVTEDPRCSAANPMFTAGHHEGVGDYLMPATPLRFSRVRQPPAGPVPMLGEHTTQVLSDVLGLSGDEIRDLHAGGVVAGHDTDRRSTP